MGFPADQREWLARLAVAAGIGFMIGIEREFSKQRDQAAGAAPSFAGLRTFTLIGVLGYLSGMLAVAVAPWLLAVVFAGFCALVVASYTRTATADVGLTSEVTAVITFLLGFLAFDGELLVAVVTAVLVLVLLSFKPQLHGFVKKLTQDEVHAIVQFVVISALVLPFLPDQGYGPDGVWNPREIWTMVILVSGISLAGYLLTKFLGDKMGTLLAGAVGGLVSSTAVTLGHARHSRDAKAASPYLALGIVVASSIMFLRMLAELAVVNSALAHRVWPALLLVAACGLCTGVLFIKRTRSGADVRPTLSNPLSFRTALQFALLYAAVRWLMSYATERFGEAGGYVAAVLSGATDVDAVTLGVARNAGDEVSHTALVTILLAALSNTAVKCIIAMAVGSAGLRRAVIPGFAAMFLATGVAIVWLTH